MRQIAGSEQEMVKREKTFDNMQVIGGNIFV